MSYNASKQSNNTVQAFEAPASGSTQALTMVAATSVKTVAALVGGFYRVLVPTGISVTMARGVFATAAALVTDMPLEAGEYHFFVADGDTLAFYQVAGGAVLSLTKMS